MIRYLLHKVCQHRVFIPGRGYAGFYRCLTCSHGWNGLFFRTGRTW